MNEFIVMLRNVLMFVALAIPGYLLVKTNVLKQEHSAILSKVLINLGIPFLVFSGTVSNLTFDRELLLTMGIVSAVFIGYGLVMFFASAPLTGMEKNEKTRGVMRFCSVFANNGFLGIPLAIAVFGRDSLVFTLLIAPNILNNILIYTLGAYLMSGDRRCISLKKAFLNPVLLAFLLGVVCKLLRVADYVPEVVSFSDYFSNLVTPISMTVLGMKLGTVRMKSLFCSWKVYYVSALKLVVFPIIVVGLLLLGRELLGSLQYTEMLLCMFIAFATPTASLGTTFADEFGSDTSSAVAFTLGSTMLSSLTIPCLYWLLNLFL